MYLSEQERTTIIQITAFLTFVGCDEVGWRESNGAVIVSAGIRGQQGKMYMVSHAFTATELKYITMHTISDVMRAPVSKLVDAILDSKDMVALERLTRSILEMKERREKQTGNTS